MAFSLNCRITIGSLVLRSVSSLEITSTWRELADVAKITIPNRGVIRTGQNDRNVEIDRLVKVGDPVRVELGYNGNSNTEFVGYVTNIKPGTPIELECEDEVWQLKRSGLITKSYANTTLKKLLQDVVIDTRFTTVPNVSIENYLVENATKAQVLQELREKYGLAIYYRLGKLYAGLPYSDRIDRKQKLVINRNVIEENLDYRKAEDVRLRVKIVSIQPDNKKVEYETGDQDGEVRTLHYYNISDKATLISLAKSELEKYKFTGYRGDVTTFGIPFLEHGEVITLEEPRFAERSGRYLIEKVTTTFGTEGFRRKVELGIKV